MGPGGTCKGHWEKSMEQHPEGATAADRNAAAGGSKGGRG
jgi:hypothetical protein